MSSSNARGKILYLNLSVSMVSLTEIIPKRILSTSLSNKDYDHSDDGHLTQLIAPGSARTQEARVCLPIVYDLLTDCISLLFQPSSLQELQIKGAGTRPRTNFCLVARDLYTQKLLLILQGRWLK